MTSKLSLFLIPLAGVFLLPGCERAPELPPGYGDWPHHQGDLAASKYVPLDQITPQNFEQLEIAWRWESADRRLGDVYDTGTYVATPLKVGDRLYTATSHGQVVALDPGTGEQLWLHDPRSWGRRDADPAAPPYAGCRILDGRRGRTHLRSHPRQAARVHRCRDRNSGPGLRRQRRRGPEKTTSAGTATGSRPTSPTAHPPSSCATPSSSARACTTTSPNCATRRGTCAPTTRAPAPSSGASR